MDRRPPERFAPRGIRSYTRSCPRSATAHEGPGPTEGAAGKPRGCCSLALNVLLRGGHEPHARVEIREVLPLAVAEILRCPCSDRSGRRRRQRHRPNGRAQDRPHCRGAARRTARCRPGGRLASSMHRRSSSPWSEGGCHGDLDNVPGGRQRGGSARRARAPRCEPLRPDYVFHGPPELLEADCPSAYGALHGRAGGPFTEEELYVTDVAANGDRVVARFDGSGRPQRRVPRGRAERPAPDGARGGGLPHGGGPHRRGLGYPELGLARGGTGGPVTSAWRRAFGGFHSALYRTSGGRVGGSFDGLSVLLLTTTGRRSGRPRRTPLLYVDDGDGYALAASYAGAGPPSGLVPQPRRGARGEGTHSERDEADARHGGG